MNELAKEINNLLLNSPEIKEFLSLKEQINNDKKLLRTRKKLDEMRKVICKDKNKDSSKYYDLLESYKTDKRIKKYEELHKKIMSLFVEISDILALK